MTPSPGLQDLYGEHAEAVELIVRALDGHHPERGWQEREQAAYVIVRTLVASKTFVSLTKLEADALFLKATNHKHFTASRAVALESAIEKIAPISGRGNRSRY